MGLGLVGLGLGTRLDNKLFSNVNAAYLGYEGLGVSFKGSLRFGTRFEG